MTTTLESVVPSFDTDANGRKLAIVCSKGRVEGIISASDFIEISEGAQIIFV